MRFHRGSILNSHLLLPGLTLIALGAIGAAAVVPLRSPDPESLVNRTRPVTPVKAPAELPGPTPSHDWTAFEAPLSSLRNPVQAAPTPEPEPEKPEDKPDIEVVERPRGVGSAPPLPWSYAGSILEGGEPILALLRLTTGERFVRVGDEVSDPTVDGGRPIVIKAISTTEVTVERNGNEQTLAYSPDAGAGRAGAGAASGTFSRDPRDVRRGGRPGMQDRNRSEPD